MFSFVITCNLSCLYQFKDELTKTDLGGSLLGGDNEW